ncbi:hypothetical protein C4J88_4651 [Pseudomonas sp. R4-39-08]|nr:hypothetical protein C4J88_4651 [Pseudomonas sp. R4-39-08]
MSRSENEITSQTKLEALHHKACTLSVSSHFISMNPKKTSRSI